MARSVWKGPFVEGYLLKKAEAARASGRHDVIKAWSRRSTILPQFVGLTFGIYDGQKHIPLRVTEEMVGHKFGEFTRGAHPKGAAEGRYVWQDKHGQFLGVDIARPTKGPTSTSVAEIRRAVRQANAANKAEK